ncbi:RagB/SusD family nutrient uptake outer membrane protein [Chitinophaga barathri]|uniref:RagB/SusD family nutrient uptake outer membrane protein n=1 Tax=Chitinophaga barathri TaxID=1647451 RepID=A0A3N4M5T3_9BACT|nr:RagB/SusD family nutrient uptake outer membrane protein [Chitinophaga barathri]RPD38385.1 RagB/SusD family nutrient uptake outer membrane protein [Chitinophaga barathri]
MKHTKLYTILATIALVSLTTGCDKLLEEKPKTTIRVGELDPTLLEQTVIGAYEPMTRSRGRLWESTVGLGFELMSEYADGGSVQSAWSNYNNIMNNPNAMQQPYTTLYEAIGRANGLINRLDENTTLDNALKQKAYGEAYFIRAVCYFFAVRTWGRLPLRLKPVITPADVPLALSDAATVYAQIITDLKFAETALPPTVNAANAGRATSGAAKVALADVYLHMGDFTNARAKAKEVMDTKATYGYDLETSLATVYSPALATNKEDVFSLKFSQVVDRGGFLASYYADSRAKQAGFSVSGNKFGGIISVAPLIKNWDDNDQRKKFSLYTNYVINGVVTAAEIEPGIYDVRLGKYKDPNAPIDTGNGNDFYFWRYADVLLIFAEAENKLNGPGAAAYEAINIVRRRGYGVSMTAPSALADLPAGLTQTQFDDMVFRERGYEFIGECKRWFDLVRTNRAAKEIGDVRAAISIPTRKPVPNILLFRLPDVEFQNNPLAQ